MDVNSFLKAFKKSTTTAGERVTTDKELSTARRTDTTGYDDGEDSISDRVEDSQDSANEDDFADSVTAPLTRRGRGNGSTRQPYAGGAQQVKDFAPLKVHSTNAELSGASTGAEARLSRSMGVGVTGVKWQRGLATASPRYRGGAMREGLKRLRTTSADAYWKELLSEKQKLSSTTPSTREGATTDHSQRLSSVAEGVEVVMIAVDDLLRAEEAPTPGTTTGQPSPGVTTFTGSESPGSAAVIDAVESETVDPLSGTEGASGTAVKGSDGPIGMSTVDTTPTAPPPQQTPSAEGRPKKMSALAKAKALARGEHT